MYSLTFFCEITSGNGPAVQPLPLQAVLSGQRGQRAIGGGLRREASNRREHRNPDATANYVDLHWDNFRSPKLLHAAHLFKSAALSLN